MNKNSTAKSTRKLLKLAQEQTSVVLTIDGRPAIVEMHDPSPPETCREGRLDMDRYLDKANWRTTGPGFQQLQEWVETHWNTENAKPAPSGMAATGDDSWVQTEVQLDAVTATKKLIAAAKLYGREPVVTIAKHFAAHGMIETHVIWLLKAPPLEVAKSLDNYCTLLPYSEALQKIVAESDPRDRSFEWAEPYADNACALQERYFEHAGPAPSDHRQYASPLLKNGLPDLTLLLGLVWGSGFRVLGNWRAVPAVAAATLPYRLTRGPGTARWPAALATKGYGPPPRKRPLVIGELTELAVKYSEHTEQTRCRLRRAMARLRNLAERFEVEDRVTDLGIALQTLFTADDEQEIGNTLIPQRAAWLYADFKDERRETEAMLARFCRRHLDVLRGRASEDYERSANLLGDTENVMRSCLKTLVSEGWPENWNAATEPSALRLDPPRPESKIPSVKSDALSWSIEEQREIDQALEEVWKPVVENAPLPPNMSPTTVAGLSPTLVARYREQRIPYVVTHPARLYLAHPKWPKTVSEPIDERTMYYCERDVTQQTQKWKEAAANKGLVQFEAPTDACLYHPRHRKDWPQPLLSSHEEESGAGTTNQQALTGTTEVSLISIAVADTDKRQHSATEEDPSMKRRVKTLVVALSLCDTPPVSSPSPSRGGRARTGPSSGRISRRVGLQPRVVRSPRAVRLTAGARDDTKTGGGTICLTASVATKDLPVLTPQPGDPEQLQSANRDALTRWSGSPPGRRRRAGPRRGSGPATSQRGSPPSGARGPRSRCGGRGAWRVAPPTPVSRRPRPAGTAAPPTRPGPTTSASADCPPW